MKIIGLFLSLLVRLPPNSTLFPYTTLFRSLYSKALAGHYAKANVAPGKALIEFRLTGADKTELRSEEHTSELQSRFDLVCRLLLEKKKLKHMTSKGRLSAS